MTAPETQKAGRREWIALAVIALPCLLYSMDLTVLYLAVPALTADLEPSSSQLLWITDVYGFMLAGLLVTMGMVGDRIGRRRLLLIGAAAFGTLSVAAAFSTSAEMLIVTRGLLGIAAATLAPSTLSLIRNLFLDPTQRAFAIGVWATSFSVGAALGPLLGGLLLEFFWWGSVFLLAVPVMVMLLVLGPMLLPEFRTPDAGRLDARSVVLSIAAVLALIYGLKQTAENGLGWIPAAFIATGIVVGVAFVMRQRKLVDPLIDLRLFRIPTFGAALAANTISLAAAFGIFLFIAQYLQLVLGLSPLRAGLWTVPSSGGFIVGSLVAPLIVRRVHHAFAMAGGLVLAAVGLVLLTRVGGGSGLSVVVAGSVLVALGVAPVVTLATDIVVGAVAPERAGAASGISETGAELGGALGIALLGSLGIAVYRNEVGDRLPSGLSHEQAELAHATLGGATQAADHLREPFATVLLDSAREAFTHGMQLAAGVGAIVALVAAAIAFVILRRVAPCADAASDVRPVDAVAVAPCT